MRIFSWNDAKFYYIKFINFVSAFKYKIKFFKNAKITQGYKSCQWSIVSPVNLTKTFIVLGFN